METTEIEFPVQWFVFFKDQLLLKKEENNTYSVPCGTEPPIRPTAGQKIQDVTLTDGRKVKAFAVMQPVSETEEWVMIGLRASYDCLPLDDYQAEKHFRYSIGTSTVDSAPYAACR